MESVRNAHSIQQLSELAGCLPAISSTTSIKAYYDSSDKLLLNAEAAHKVNHMDEEYMWLMRFVILIYERMPNHDQYNKTAEAQRLNRVYRGKCQHVLNRLEVLKNELAYFYETKARLLADQEAERAQLTNPRAKSTTAEIPTESDLMARLSRLKQPSAPKATASIDVTPLATENPISNPKEAPQTLDFSIFDFGTKPSTSATPKVRDPLEDLKLIPDVEIKDDRLDLSWLEDDPTFGSKNRKIGPEPVPNMPSLTPYPSILAMTSESDNKDPLPDWVSRTLKKQSPPAYSSIKPLEKPVAPTPVVPSKPTTKYSVTTVLSEPEPPPRSPFSLPAFSEPAPSFSITQTIRGQQFDPDAMNKRLLDTTVGATCTDYIVPPPETLAGASQASSAPNPHNASPSTSLLLQSPSTSASKLPKGDVSQIIGPSTSSSPSGASNPRSVQFEGTKAPIGPTSASQKAQFVPVVVGGANAAHYLYQPSPTSQACLPVMGNVPVVFRPNQLNMFDPSKVTMMMPSPSAFPASAVSSGSFSASPSPVSSSPSPLTAMGSANSERPPKYKKAGSASPSSGSKGTSSAKPAAPSYSSVTSKSSGALNAKPTSKSPKSSSSSVSAPHTAAASSASSAFPLMTNQRPGAAVIDHTLRKIEMDGDMFDKFMSSAHRNTARSIETCGILAGKFLAHKQLFRVTHLIIPKQTGTTDTCATTNEDEIFEFQIKHDLLTLGWIHTHPTQACFLSSVDLHTHCSYQSLFPEAVAVVIAPRDTPNFSFFHLSDSGFQTVQNCPLTGFHHHPERGLYQACSHVVLSWNSKVPCKVVDMR